MPELTLAKLEHHISNAARMLCSEGINAATYKDYIFGILFLKRCSDLFEPACNTNGRQKVEQGITMAANSCCRVKQDSSDELLVPESARWSYLQSKIHDSDIIYGYLLDTALREMTMHNESLAQAFDHISFMQIQNDKRVISDDLCKELVRHFSYGSYRMLNDNLRFSELLGKPYEFRINKFVASAGKKVGEFYTPREVIDLMVRIIKPQPGFSVYDPMCGTGGTLIISREYVSKSGGDTADLRLCGQVNNISAWVICKLKMLFHGILGADIRFQDTIQHPLHRIGDKLEQFDRIISSPPPCRNYTKSNMENPERFRWGWCRTAGKKSDLMLVQHMLAVCKPDGVVTTVTPNGVLYRDGEEFNIRSKFLKEDLIEAVISLPPNMFYKNYIPISILVLRPNPSRQSPNPNKIAERRGKVMFINSSAEYFSGRSVNYLRLNSVEKIIHTYERFDDVPGYARRVSLEDITNSDNDGNLDACRYVESSPSIYHI